MNLASPSVTLVNTAEFLRSRQHFEKTGGFESGGMYTRAPFKSREYMEFWKEEMRRCREGFTVGGLHITGPHYWYLNYCPITKVSFEKGSKVGERREGFADFWAVDLDFFNTFAKAQKEGKHMVVLKCRASGFSFKLASLGTWNYHFLPKSKSFYFAGDEGFLTKDGILSKCWDMLQHHNKNTQRAFLKNRQVKDNDLHKRSSYKKGNNEWGYQSEIIGRVVDKAKKVRGGRGRLVAFEESGSFPALLDAWIASRGLMEQNGIVAGTMVAFGTGGDDSGGLDSLEELFYNPGAYNVLGMENVWDSDVPSGQKTGLFIPRYLCMQEYMDEQGNVDALGAMTQEMEARQEIQDQNPKPGAVDKYAAENAMTPRESLMRVSNTLFPIKELEAQYQRSMSPSVQSFTLHGRLGESAEKGLFFQPTDEKPVPYPAEGYSKRGCITLWEKPIFRDGKVPDGLYFGVLDPYYRDHDTGESVGALYIFKNNNNFSTTLMGLPVACYVARPPQKQEFYTNVFRLIRFYNARMQSEIAGGGEDVVSWAKQNHFLHLLEYEPMMYHRSSLAASSAGKSFFMNMNKERKKLGLEYVSDWLVEDRAVKADGSKLYNYHFIYDPWLLKELMQFNPDGNYDRVSAIILAMYMLRENAEKIIQEKSKSRSLRQTTLY